MGAFISIYLRIGHFLTNFQYIPERAETIGLIKKLL